MVKQSFFNSFQDTKMCNPQSTQKPSRIKKERNSVIKSTFHPTTSQNMSQIILIYRYLPLHLYITAHLIVRSHSRSEELSEAIICIPFGLFLFPSYVTFLHVIKKKKERKSFPATYFFLNGLHI